MASSKDRYAAIRWLADRFAAGKWRGDGNGNPDPANSSKDRYEAARWNAGRFAAGKWRGLGVAAARTYPVMRAVIVRAAK